MDGDNVLFSEGGQFGTAESKPFEHFSDNITGISGELNQTVQIFPNPTTGKIYIKDANNSNVNVYSISGKRVASYQGFYDSMIDISGLDNGIYFIKVVVENKNVITTKISLLK